MRLRPQRKPVLRLSRKALITGGVVAAVGVAAALAVAMTPPKPKPAAPGADETAPIHTPLAAEKLNGLPKDYAGVPKLGPPLPGDLGRPILSAAQPSGSGEPTATMPSAQPAASPQTQYEQQAAQARISARSSQLFFARSTVPEPNTAATAPQTAPTASASFLPASITPTQSESDPLQSFLDRPSDRQTSSFARLTPPASPYLVQAGSVVPAALITGIQSDIPGQVIAQITQDVPDSLTGQFLLIPKGSRLLGQYDHVVAFGQSRLLLTWSRLILPNGKSLTLDKLPATDRQGFAGLQDRTDNHWPGIVSAAALSTLFSVGSQAGDTQDDTVLIRALRDGAGESINRAGQAVVERQLTVRPTLTIRAGLPVRVVLSRDLILEPYGD